MASGGRPCLCSAPWVSGARRSTPWGEQGNLVVRFKLEPIQHEFIRASGGGDLVGDDDCMISLSEEGGLEEDFCVDGRAIRSSDLCDGVFVVYFDVNRRLCIHSSRNSAPNPDLETYQRDRGQVKRGIVGRPAGVPRNRKVAVAPAAPVE